MFTEEQLQFIYSVIKDTVFVPSMEPDVQLKLLRDQDTAYELMKSVLDPAPDQPTHRTAND
jgi:hypothetical protein